MWQEDPLCCCPAPPLPHLFSWKRSGAVFTAASRASMRSSPLRVYSSLSCRSTGELGRRTTSS